MKFAGIDFPRALLNAMRDNNLVVFAGAGVSMGDPSHLPSFESLAQQIADGTGKECGNSEPIDRFLGRLQHGGVAVHQRAARALQIDGIRPTRLHHDLLRCFLPVHAIRIVTTNFDQLFEEAIDLEPTLDATVFQAPALPRGTDFSGLVHVHGRVDNVKDMVLTDADFGRAYLTEGWALRFLNDLFRTYSVLFVGYRHNDAILTYLGRALPANSGESSGHPQRFALTEPQGEVEVDHWNLLGITPIEYEHSGDHAALYTSVAKLASYLQRDLIAWKRVISGIAEKIPPIEPEEVDTIEDALHDGDRLLHFVNAADSIDWLEWLIHRGEIERILSAAPTSENNDPHRLISRWLAKHFVHHHGDMLLSLLVGRRITLSALLWRELVVAIGERDDHHMEKELLGKWVTYLIHSQPTEIAFEAHMLLRLGSVTDTAGMSGLTVDIFHVMCPIQVAMFGDSSENSWHVGELWKRHLRPRIGSVAEPLLSCAVNLLTQRHDVQRIWHGATRDHSWDSAHVQHLGVTGGEHEYRRISGILAEVVLMCLAHLTKEHPDIARYKYEELIRKDAPLLRRIAVWCAKDRLDVSTDELLIWLFEQIGLQDRSSRNEFMKAISSRFGDASHEVRRMVISQITEFAVEGGDQEESETVAIYWKLRWLHQLREAAADCELTSAALMELRDRHPDAILGDDTGIPRDAAFLNVGWDQSPWGSDEMLALPSSDWLDVLVELEGSPNGQYVRQSVIEQIAEAIDARPEWGLELADSLIGQERWIGWGWEAIWQTWQGDLESDQFLGVLARCREPRIQSQFTESVCRVLHGLVGDGGRPYTLELLDQAQDVAEQLMPEVLSEQGHLERHDWLTAAINRAVGPLAEFWFGSLAAEIRAGSVESGELPQRYRVAFTALVTDATDVGRMARAILMSRFPFLASVDETWLREHLLPSLLVPESEHFQAAWDGLMYANLTLPCVDLLMDAFKIVAGYIDRLDSAHTRQRFIDYMASLLTDFVDEPLKKWLPIFLSKASEEDRVRFAWAVWKRLGEMSDSAQIELWNRWLMEYWQSRLDGVPVALSEGEIERMACWTMQLHSLFPQGVQLAVQMPANSFRPEMLFHRIAESGVVEREPDAVADLLLHAANSADRSYLLLDGGELSGTLLESGVSEDQANQLRELQLKLGFD